jgi:hypothetical protein
MRNVLLKKVPCAIEAIVAALADLSLTNLRSFSSIFNTFKCRKLFKISGNSVILSSLSDIWYKYVEASSKVARTNPYIR